MTTMTAEIPQFQIGDATRDEGGYQRSLSRYGGREPRNFDPYDECPYVKKSRDPIRLRVLINDGASLIRMSR